MGIGNSFAYAIERVLAPVEGMHKVITGRWFDVMGPVGARAESAYWAASGLVYGSIRIGARAIGGVVDAVRSGGHHSDDAVDAWVNGLWGDDLGNRPAGLATSMTVRDAEGHSVPLGSAVTDAFPGATGHLVVLVHGLVKNERAWRGTDTEPGLAPTLASHPDLTPVLIRYNTGLEIPANAISLDAIIEELVAEWPVPVESISLVGHSMGGLVVVGAYAEGRKLAHRWAEHAREVITIGAPHRGAPLEKVVKVAAMGLGAARATRPLAEFFNRRSGGIKGLGFGVADGDLGVGPVTQPRYRSIAGVVTSDPQHPIGRVVGDLMVRPSSTAPPGWSSAGTAVVGGVNHFNMLHNPTVVDRVLGWLNPTG